MAFIAIRTQLFYVAHIFTTRKKKRKRKEKKKKKKKNRFSDKCTNVKDTKTTARTLQRQTTVYILHLIKVKMMDRIQCEVVNDSRARGRCVPVVSGVCRLRVVSLLPCHLVAPLRLLTWRCCSLAVREEAAIMWCSGSNKNKERVLG